MGRTVTRMALAPLALLALLPFEGEAMAALTVLKTKGADATATFVVEQVRTCPSGGTVVESTTVDVQMFETQTRVRGVLTTSVQTIVAANRFDLCTAEFLSGFAIIEGGNLRMTALSSATVAGQFELDGDFTIGLNLTLTGSDTLEAGSFMQRSNLGGVLKISRARSASRTATLSGTVSIDGVNFTAAQMVASSARLARNTGGEITILKP